MSNSHSYETITETSPPRVLWHYTDINGFLGIIESNSIWATSASFLNDAEEVSYGISALRAALLQVSEDLGGRTGEVYETGEHTTDNEGNITPVVQADTGPGWNLWVRADRWGHEGQPTISLPDAYTCSFCEDGDLLSQWRGYANNQGYAIGFDAEKLSQMSEYEGSIDLVRVRYGNDGRLFFESQIKSMLNEENDVTDKQLNDLCQLAPACKNPAFSEENEWRIIITNPTGAPSVRAAAIGLVPYFSLPLPAGAIAAVCVGPGSNAELRERATRVALQARNMSAVNVSVSKAPFRG